MAWLSLTERLRRETWSEYRLFVFPVLNVGVDGQSFCPAVLKREEAEYVGRGLQEVSVQALQTLEVQFSGRTCAMPV